MSNPRQKARIWFFLVVIFLIVLYVLFQSKNLLSGPQIEITEPKDGATLSYNLVTVKGNAQNIAYIHLNDRLIFIDEKGIFSEKLIAPPGYSIIKVEAQDKFGKTIEKFIRVYMPESAVIPISTVPASTTVATSTASST